MDYRKAFFNPDPVLQDFRSEEDRLDLTPGDRRDGKLYRYSDKIILAINVAIATGRPLLVSGPTGCGKSSLAFNAARFLTRCYYEVVVTSRTEARDLLWHFDAVRRLADAQAERGERGDGSPSHLRQGVSAYFPYIAPRELWWILDPASAIRRGQPGPHLLDTTQYDQLQEDVALDPAKWDPMLPTPKTQTGLPPDPQTMPYRGAVLLIDEIDKADPDMPNNLLVALGSLAFDVELINQRVQFQGDRNKVEDRPLVFITTNRERPLPRPFLRRCVVLQIDPPGYDNMKEIAIANYGQHEELYSEAWKVLLETKSSSAQREGLTEVSTAEFLDTVRACLALSPESGVIGKDFLTAVAQETVWKEVERQR